MQLLTFRSLRLALAALATSLLCACAPTPTLDRNSLRVGNGDEPRDLDPHVVTGIPEVKIINALLEGLLTYHPSSDTEPAPGAAQAWQVSDDGLTWHFFLRPDGRWSNGDPVTAHDFVFAWQRALSPALGCEYADWFFMIRNAEAFNSGLLTDFSKVGIHAADDLTFVVQLNAPVPDFIHIILNHSFLPVHRPTIERHGPIDRRGSGWSRPPHFVGNGPFQLVDWQPNARIRVERNPFYWDAHSVRLDAIEFFPINDEHTEQRMFDANRLHITNSVPVNRRDWYRAHQPDALRQDPYAGVYFYRLNTTVPPLDDPRVRKALHAAIDKERIVSRILRSGERPAFAVVPDGLAGYHPPASDSFAPVYARNLLAEAGFPNGTGFPSLELLFNTSDNHRMIAVAIQDMWRQHLGIEVTLHNQEWQTYLSTTKKMNYNIARAGWIGSVYPWSFLRIYTTANPNNETGWSNPAFDQLIDQAIHTIDPTQRLSLTYQAESLLLQDLPILPIFWYTNVFLIHPNVQGWNPKLLDLRNYKDVWLQN